MSKELPFFKFFPSEWLSGNITLESYQIQGLFINICCYYWQRDCKVSKKNLLKKFNNDEGVNILIESGIVKITEDKVSIGFLLEQKAELTERRKKLSDSGKLGNKKRWEKKDSNQEVSHGDTKAIAELSQPDRNIDRDKEEDINNIVNFSIHDEHINEIIKRKDTIYAVWLEGVYVNFKLTKGSVGKLLKSFATHLKIDGKCHSDFNDFKKHFNNWLRKQESLGKLNEYKYKQTGQL